MLGLSVPGFWLAVILVTVFSVNLHWLPTSGRAEPLSRVLPVISVAWVAIAQIMRVTRSSMLEVLGSDYIKMARIKGLRERVVIWKHALRNALVPVLGITGFLIAMLVGGLALVESVFNWPGIGNLLISAVVARDFPLCRRESFWSRPSSSSSIWRSISSTGHRPADQVRVMTPRFITRMLGWETAPGAPGASRTVDVDELQCKLGKGRRRVPVAAIILLAPLFVFGIFGSLIAPHETMIIDSPNALRPQPGWTEAAGRTSWVPTSSGVICSAFS